MGLDWIGKWQDMEETVHGGDFVPAGLHACTAQDRQGRGAGPRLGDEVPVRPVTRDALHRVPRAARYPPPGALRSARRCTSRCATQPRTQVQYSPQREGRWNLGTCAPQSPKQSSFI